MCTLDNVEVPSASRNNQGIDIIRDLSSKCRNKPRSTEGIHPPSLDQSRRNNQFSTLSIFRMTMLRRVNLLSEPWFIMINRNVNCNVLTCYIKNA